MAGFLARFLKDQSGATAIEYGLIGVLVCLAIITGASALGSAMNSKFSMVASSVSAAP